MFLPNNLQTPSLSIPLSTATTTTTTTMYRTAAKRLFMAPLRTITLRSLSFISIHSSPSSSPFCTSSNHSNPNPNFSQSEIPNFNPHSNSDKDKSYKDQQSLVLQASLLHVIRLGWSETAMIAGARDVGISPSIVGSIPRKEAALVEYFMDECLEKLIDIIESDMELKNLIPSQRIAKLVRTRLEMQAPYISKWPQALSIQALPTNVPTSFKQRAALVDEIWHAAGDDGSDLDWYVKRTVLGGIYSTTEVYMLTDNSPDFRDTWAFLDARVRDAFDLKKTLQEASYLAETVGAGLGKPLQGLVKEIFKG